MKKSMFRLPLLLAAGFVSMGAGKPGAIPISAKNEKARQSYLEGRALLEAMRPREAKVHFDRALAEDPEMPLAHLGLAEMHGLGMEERFARVDRALAAAKKCPDGERLLIESHAANMRGDGARATELLLKLSALHPEDQRVHTQLGFHYTHHMLSPAQGVKAFERALQIDAKHAAAYNGLGYAYLELSKYPEAEQAFKKYVELIPDHPNPHDSYAELLMKMGRFEESIASYQRALKLDPLFTSAHLGIGANQVFLGRGDAARKAYAELLRVAPDFETKHDAMHLTALSYVDEGATEKALEVAGEMKGAAKAANDLPAISRTLRLMGNILMEAGRAKEAEEKFEKRIMVLGKLNVPEAVKQRMVRLGTFDLARAALAGGDLATAKSRAAQFATKVAKEKLPDDLLLQHELAGRIALAEKKYDAAIVALDQAGKGPGVSYLLGEAWTGKGDAGRARGYYRQVAEFNSFYGGLPFVRSKARRILADSKS